MAQSIGIIILVVPK